MITIKTILTLSNWQRVLKHYFRFWWLLFRKMILFFALLAAACATTQPIESHSLDGWTIVYSDFATMEKVCPTQFSKENGCTVMSSKTMYCIKGDHVVCGHELLHATDGDWHGRRKN